MSTGILFNWNMVYFSIVIYMLERIDLAPYNIGQWVEQAVADGESGNEAYLYNFDWVLES